MTKKTSGLASLLISFIPAFFVSSQAMAQNVPKVCWNVATGALSIRLACLKAGHPGAPKGETATEIPTSKPGPRAYGFVYGDGSLDRTRSSTNVSSRRLPNASVYCIKALGVDPKTAVPVASTDFSLSSCASNAVQPISRLANSGCTEREFAFRFSTCVRDDEPAEEQGNAFSFIVP